MKKIITKVAHTAENSFDTLTQHLLERLRADGKVHIHPYLGFGNQERIFLRGRVLRGKQVPLATDEDNFVENLLNAWQHIASDEIPNIQLQAQIGGLQQTFTTDEEGYFVVDMENPQLPPSQVWHELKLELLDPPDGQPVAATGEIVIPSQQAQFGIISDIDDTVLQSKATNYLAAAHLMFFKNAKTRLPFDGVAELYQALHKNAQNPLYFVSSSPWNLYDLLTDFFAYQSIPKAPLFLVDYGISAEQLIKPGHGTHKFEQINKILNMSPELNFVLIGDSGQHDPEIYRDVIKRHPGRILAAYIRDVTGQRRDEQVRHIAAEVTASGTDMLLAADSKTIAAHAQAKGWIT